MFVYLDVFIKSYTIRPANDIKNIYHLEELVNSNQLLLNCFSIREKIV
jgi:hypothetical protein